MGAAAEKQQATINQVFSFSVERSPILKALARAQGIVERRNTIPILGNVLLEVNDAGLSLTATDMDITLQEQIALAGNLPLSRGSTTVPLHMLHDIIRKLPDGAPIELNCQGGSVELACGKASFTIPALPAEDFPQIDHGQYPHEFAINSHDLARLIDKSRFAMSTETTRYFLNGLFLHVVSGGDSDLVLRCVATDGHRLAQAEMPMPEGAKNIPGVIVPRKAIGELSRLLDDAPEQVQLALSETKLRLSCGNIHITTKLIDGKYPDYARVIPQNNTLQAHVVAKVFADAVDRVATVSAEKNRAVKVALERAALTITATGGDSSLGAETIDADIAQAGLQAGFNARYLLDALAQIDGERCTLHFADETAPVLITDPAASGALYVLMPMRV